MEKWCYHYAEALKSEQDKWGPVLLAPGVFMNSYQVTSFIYVKYIKNLSEW